MKIGLFALLVATLAVTLLATVLLFSSRSSPTQKEISDQITAEEYLVYSALLDNINKSPEDGKNVELFVINNATKGPSDTCLPTEIARWDERIVAREFQPLLKDLLAKNKNIYPVSSQFNLSRKVTFLNSKDFSSIFRDIGFDGWGDFYKKYPASAGYITFSRVGFNPDVTEAILYTETNCGGLCGYGHYIVLVKEIGVWKKKTGFGCWQS